jgi:hypothetical protein
MQWVTRLALLAGAGFLMVGARGASAQVPPARVFGTVTVDGATPPVGTKVEAFIGDMLCGEGTVRRLGAEIPVGYVVDVKNESQEPGCGGDDRKITIKIGGREAPQTTIYETGSFIRLDLEISGTVQTPTPTPTPLPGALGTQTPTATPAASPTAEASPTPAATMTASPTATEPAATSPTAAPSPAGTASPTGTPAATATPSGAVITVTPPPSAEGEGGGVPAALVLLLVLAAAAIAGALIYLYVRRSRL